MKPRLPRERKPTEAALNAIIRAYQAAYVEASRAAAEAAVESLRSGGKLGVRLPEAREAYLAALVPILDHTEAAVGDAIRLGAGRRWRGKRREDVERLVKTLVPQARSAREGWLKKMATDFISTVVVPALAPEDEHRASWDAPSGASASWRAADEDEDPFESLAPGAFNVRDPDKAFEFGPQLLLDLLRRGYRFGMVRAVEATEYDVWHGDDVAYIEASREDGVAEFVWRTSEDPLVCPVCDALDGERYTPAEAARASADRGEHTHCRCRCWFEAVEAAG